MIELVLSDATGNALGIDNISHFPLTLTGGRFYAS